MTAPRSILLAAPNWVGDTLFMLPAAAALRRGFPQAGISLLARPGLCRLLAASPLFDERLELAPGGRLAKFAALWRLRPRRFDLALVFAPSFSSGLAAWLSGARRRVGFGGQGRFLFLNRLVDPRLADRSRHVSEEYLELARAAGAQPEPGDLRTGLGVTQEGAEEANRLFGEHGLAGTAASAASPKMASQPATARPGREEDGPAGQAALVALCPSSAYGPSKRWPPRHFAALARDLKERRFTPFFLGAPQERAEISALAAESGGLPALLPSLPGLAACLERAGTVVANDSGPLHLASALGVRALGLYGPVHPRWSGPLSHRAAALHTGEPCSPCFARRCPLGHHACLENLEPARVIEALLELLKR